MTNQTLSFGILMLIENTITLTLIADLIRRVSIKVYLIRHPHLKWPSGQIFLAYLLFAFLHISCDAFLSFNNYILENSAIEINVIAFRVFVTTLVMIGKIMLWYYSINGGFVLFKKK